MFCNQCEQTARPGCAKRGVCGKSPETATVQNALVFALRGLALVALAAHAQGMPVRQAGRLMVRGLFATVTNVNFDNTPLLALLFEIINCRNAMARQYQVNSTLPVATFAPADLDAVLASEESIDITRFAADADCASLAQTLLYGLKGAAAYADHAAVLGQECDDLYLDMFRALVLGFDGATPGLNDWVAAALHCGKINLRAMELLDIGNTTAFGHPVPTSVSLAPRPGPAILVTGHDLKDLADLLAQTEGKGINIYTHGEMLPAHGYPELKKYPHLAGHFGTAWQNQQNELPAFPGPVLFTTNCIQKPEAGYADNVFTTGLVGWPGIRHVANGDFGPVIERALQSPGYSADFAAKAPKKSVMVGFGHNAVLGVADKIIAAVKKGAIRHFFLVGGCDGAKPGRNYYTEFVEKTPKDTVVLTLACGKFRFFDKDLGQIEGLPRLLDIGQCNDAHSAVKIATALAGAFNCQVNELPLSLVLSWYEQKAVAILLSLLALGIRNIKLGPTLPAFITPNVLQVLVDNFQISPISTPDEDLAACLGKA